MSQGFLHPNKPRLAPGCFDRNTLIHSSSISPTMPTEIHTEAGIPPASRFLPLTASPTETAHPPRLVELLPLLLLQVL